jgi:hypothetical protein
MEIAIAGHIGRIAHIEEVRIDPLGPVRELPGTTGTAEDLAQRLAGNVYYAILG